MSEVKLSVVIVSWNVCDLLEKCLYSLLNTQQNIDFEIIVVDNGSSDGTVWMVKDKYPNIKLIANEDNQGFARGCHQGADKAIGDFLLFLNDDIIVFDNTLSKTVEYFKNTQNVGVLGTKILNSDKTIQESVRSFPSFYDQFIILSKLHNFWPRLLLKYLRKDFDYTKIQNVDQVMGAYFLTSKNIWNSFGGFDKNFYIWYEEVDFCKRLHDQGLEIVYYSDASIIHHGGASFKQLRALPEQKMLNKSLLYYAKKHFSNLEYLLLNLFIPINLIFTFLVSILDKFNINPKK